MGSSARHTRGMRAAAALGALLVLLVLLGVVGGATTMYAEEEEADEGGDSDSAPFMVAVEHEGGDWRCGGALVSVRTALTSAWCFDGPDHPHRHPVAVWVVAAATLSGQAARRDGSRRVARVTLPGAGAEAGGGAVRTRAWGGALLDMALLELEAPFGSGARARPILMATMASECAAPAACHVVRTLPATPHARHVRLRIADAALVGEAECAARVPYWSAARARALCLQGPELCARDWGAGVVCGGKLCAVVSRGGEEGEGGGAGGAAAAAAHCARTHVAQSVPRWRSFLHCAHSLRACGRGTCTDVCTDLNLLDPEPPPSAPPAPPAPPPASPRPAAPASDPPPPPVATSRGPPMYVTDARGTPTRTSPHPPPPAAPPDSVAVDAGPGQAVFEPNRPDFRTNGPARTVTGVWLKAGEYGDNAADYAADDVPRAPSTTTAPPASTPPTRTAPLTTRSAPPAPRLEAAPRAAPPPPPEPHTHPPASRRGHIAHTRGNASPPKTHTATLFCSVLHFVMYLFL